MAIKYLSNYVTVLCLTLHTTSALYAESLVPTPFIKDVGPVTEGIYETVSIPNDEVDQYLIIANDLTATPKPLQGLWWLDGNIQPDEVISFAKVKWQPKFNFWGQITGYEGDFVVFDDRVWSWHDSEEGLKAFNKAFYTQLIYKIRFNGDFSEAVFIPNFKLFGDLDAITIPNFPVLDFRMTQINENEYSRDTNFFGIKNFYRFRRIVDGNGQRLPAYDEFVEKAEAKRQLIPQCLEDEGFKTFQLSSCAQKALFGN